MNFENPSAVLHQPVVGGRVGWRSPSNLAIVKYWGKYGNQLPRNPSFSFTLSEAYTETVIFYEAKTSQRKSSLSFSFEGRPEPAFALRIEKFLDSLKPYFPFLTQLSLKIESRNSFPHSSGIASSASSMSALALGLCSIEKKLFNQLQDQKEFFQKASFIARLGSGSASRSVYPVGAIWGKHPSVENSNNEYAIPWANEVSEVFKNLRNSILIVSPEKKKVSSTAGHALMENNIYSTQRYVQAHNRLESLIKSLHTGNIELFGKICEDEALTLHALMMCSEPSYMLMEPNSIAIIKKVRAFRRESHVPVYFSLDAGPNIHLLYPDSSQNAVMKFINEELSPLCVDGKVISDQVGSGPKRVD